MKNIFVIIFLGISFQLYLKNWHILHEGSNDVDITHTYLNYVFLKVVKKYYSDFYTKTKRVKLEFWT